MWTARSALLLALVLAALACEPAAATFPGRNGYIVLTTGDGSRYVNQHISLLRFAPRLGVPRETLVCDEIGSVASLRCLTISRGAFAPDGARLAATVFEGAVSALWTLNPDGQRIDRVPLSTNYGEVRWAPNESAFIAVGDMGVVALNGDGSERSLLASGATAADWCADGRVVVARYGEIWVLDVSRPGGSRRLTWKGGADPSCEPDSSRVAFTRRDAIWTISTNGGRARRLTPGYAPVWSPDGKQIAYLREIRRTEWQTHLYRVGLRRLIVRQVSNEPLTVDDAYSDRWVQDPDWQPLPRR
jgi:Tol biopolymer transport system component